MGLKTIEYVHVHWTVAPVPVCEYPPAVPAADELPDVPPAGHEQVLLPAGAVLFVGHAACI